MQAQEQAPATPIETVEVTVSMPKEMAEIKTFIIEILKDFKAGKSTVEIAGENLTNLMGAVQGFEKLGVEAQSAAAIDCGALMGSEIVKVLMGKA